MIYFNSTAAELNQTRITRLRVMTFVGMSSVHEWRSFFSIKTILRVFACARHRAEMLSTCKLNIKGKKLKDLQINLQTQGKAP